MMDPRDPTDDDETLELLVDHTAKVLRIPREFARMLANAHIRQVIETAEEITVAKLGDGGDRDSPIWRKTYNEAVNTITGKPKDILKSLESNRVYSNTPRELLEQLKDKIRGAMTRESGESAN